MKNLPLIVLAIAMLVGCSAKHVPAIKAAAPKVFQQAGFEIIGYEGFNYGSGGQWGGCVWYSLRRIPDNGILYDACIAKWGDEFHIYNLTAVDAIKPGAK